MASDSVGGRKKEARKANFLKKIFNGDQAAKSASFNKRKPTLKKKAKELETLCGINVCIVCYDANGNVDFWPQNRSEVIERCFYYKGLDTKEKKEWNYEDLLHSRKNKLVKKKNFKGKKNNVDSLISNLWNRVDGLSGVLLRDSVADLDAKLKKFKQRIEFLKRRQEEVKTEKVITADECFSDLANFESEEKYSLICLDNTNNYYGYFEDTGFEFHGGTENYFGNMGGEEERLGMMNYNYSCNYMGTGQNSNSNSLISNQRSSTIYDVMPISEWNSSYDQFQSV